MFWLAPIAWWGLLTLALPILIHLLVRQESRRVPFPTLRFLRRTRLASLQRRSIHEWPLLAVRIAILAVAVAALAGPVFVSAARRASWDARVSRAIVLTPGVEGSLVDTLVREERRAAHASEVFAPRHDLRDGLRAATEWAGRQPPSARELVIAGDIRDGSLTAVDLASIPANTGLRFLPVSVADAPPELHIPVLTEQETRSVAVLMSTDETRVRYEPARGESDAFAVRAAAADQRVAEAARGAVLANGVALDTAGTRRVIIAFEGSDTADLGQIALPPSTAWMREALERLPGVTGGEAQGRLVVQVPARAIDAGAVRVLERVARAVFVEDRQRIEPRRVAPATLAAWSRPPGPAPDDVPLGDEGDRRWLWGLALVLMLVEHLLRRQARAPRAAIDRQAGADGEDVRVA